DDAPKSAGTAGATVGTQPGAGLGAQKTSALPLPRGDWVLSIDADERVPAPLATEILSTIRVGSISGYEIARLSTFLGRPMRHSGWFPDYVLRLFRREKARFSNDPVHERVICEGPISRLSGVLDHHPVLRLEGALM